jgi:hypothetical protein
MSHHQNHHTYPIGRWLRVLLILAALASEVEQSHQQKLEPPIDMTITSLQLSDQLPQLIVAVVAATLLPLQIRLQRFNAPPLFFNQSCRPALTNDLNQALIKEEYNKELETHFTTKMSQVLIPILFQSPDIFYGRIMARDK